MDKEIIRKETLAKRDKHEDKYIAEKGNLVKEKLFSLPEYKKAKTVMFFVSFGKEIYTHDMINEALKEKTVAVPKIVDNRIVACQIKDFKELKKGKYGILEPADVKRIDKVDIIIVPGVSFDMRGHRIGYGKGYYDDFLSKSKAIKIGICMDCQIVRHVPNHEWDIKVDRVITESESMSSQ